MNDSIDKYIETLQSHLCGIEEEAYPLGGTLKKESDKDFSCEMSNIYKCIDSIRCSLYEIQDKLYNDDEIVNDDESKGDGEIVNDGESKDDADKPIISFTELLRGTW